ncbi:MAG TPA: ABC transporter permease [Streptosporangiaceae bacterium]
MVAISRRNLRRPGRAPNLLLLSLTTGVLFVLLFRYVFGGAIRTPGISHADYVMPGAFILTVTASAVTTIGVGFAEDLASGAIDRFRSLPIARSAVLSARMLSDAVRLLLLIALMTAVGFAVGFRIHTGIGPALAGLALTIAIAMAFSWAMLYLALASGTAEATQAAGQTLRRSVGRSWETLRGAASISRMMHRIGKTSPCLPHGGARPLGRRSYPLPPWPAGRWQAGCSPR